MTGPTDTPDHEADEPLDDFILLGLFGALALLLAAVAAAAADSLFFAAVSVLAEYIGTWLCITAAAGLLLEEIWDSEVMLALRRLLERQGIAQPGGGDALVVLHDPRLVIIILIVAVAVRLLVLH
jgi:hypothetical protein